MRGDGTSDTTMAALIDLARRSDKTQAVARDTPGFIVNRVARPFYLEALRLLGERMPEGSGTRLSVVVDYTLPGSILGKIADKLLVEKRNEADLEEGLKKLKELLEGR